MNPYKGLRAFEESDVADFHGRTSLVDELLDVLGQPDARLLAVVGPSGSGKSSVVRAGLVSALRAGRLPGSSQWFVTSMLPVLGPSAAYPMPLTVYRRADGDGTYVSLTDFPVTGAVWAAAAPGHPEAGGDVLAVVWGGVVGDEMSGSMFRLDTPGAPSLLSTAQIDGLTAGDLDPRLRWIVADSIVTGRVHVYDLQSGSIVTTLPMPASDEELTGIRFDPAGGRLLVSSSGGHSELYDTETWTRRDEGIVDQHDIAVGYWNDDGSLLATASSNGQITIRDSETFEEIRHLAGPQATLNLTDHDNVARLWDVGSGQQIGPLSVVHN